MKSRIHIKRIIALFLVLPPILFFPFLLAFQVKKMYYPQTWNLSKEERKIFFLKIAMPELTDEYFELLKKAEKYLTHDKKYFLFEIGDKELPRVALLSRAFSPFWLSPSRFMTDTSNIKDYYKIYYRKKPLSGEKILETINGEKQSYIVEFCR